MSNPSNPLKADESRQAVSTLGGYAHQVWRSVYAWVTLQPGHRLVLEGAEDIDILGPVGAETVQVKAVGANITLRSEDALEAVFNYWAHRTRNPGVPINFRLMTTAERGQETGDPFAGMRGLDYWDRCRRPGTDLEALRAFLLAREFKTGGRTDEAKEEYAAILTHLLVFLRDAPQETVRDELIRRIHWDTSQDATADVRELVNRVVEDYGLRHHGLAPSESRRVVPLLLDRAWEVVCSKGDRVLEYVEFARIVEEHLTVRVPIAASQALYMGTGGLSRGVFGEGGSLHSQFEALPLFRSAAPVDGAHFLERTGLVSGIAQSLYEHGIATIAGSTGMGKSTLARLVVEDFPAEWSVLDLRGESPEGLRTRIDQAVLLLPRMPEGRGYVIDDLNFDEDVARYEATLLSFLRETRDRGDVVLITTQGELPTRVAAELHLTVESTLTIPPLEADEVAELALKHGCPPKAAEGWARTIHANTSGHPQLTHAAVRNRQAAGWDENPPLLLNDRGLDNVQREARQRLRDQLVDADSRRLAYRLTIFAHPFRRTHALELAESETAGESFERLLGPWIERIDDDRFRVSPLLAGSAAETYAPTQLRDLHRAAARAIMADRRISSPELAGLFTHGLASGTTEALITAFLAYQQIPTEHRGRVAPFLITLALTHVRNGKPLYSDNALTSVMLRSIQFEIATILSPDELAPQVAFAWEAEIHALETELAADMIAGLRWTFAIGTLIRTDARLPFAWIIDNTLDALRNGGLGALPSSVELPALPEEMGGLDSVLLQSLRHRCRTPTDALEVLRELSQRSDEDVRLLLASVERDHGLAEGLVQRTAIELFGNEPDTSITEEGTALAIALGERLNLPTLVAAGFRARAARASEVDRHDEQATALLDEGVKAVGCDHPLLEDWRARAHFTAERLHQAAETWKALLPRWIEGSLILRAYSTRDAVMAAGRTGDWEGALRLAESGEQLMEQVLSPGMAAGLRAEQAFALWKLSRYPEAVERYADAVERAEALGDPKVELRAHVLQKMLGHAILWSYQTFTERELPDVVEPPAGAFSAPEPREDFRELPLQPVAATWQLLATLADAVGADAAIQTRAEQRTAHSTAVPTVFFASDQQIRRSLRDGPIDDLVHAWARMQSTMNQSIGHVRAGGDILDVELDGGTTLIHDRDLPLALHVLAMGLVRAAGTRELDRTPLSAWRDDLHALGFNDALLDKWFALADALQQGTGSSQALEVLLDSDSPGPLRTIAALVVAVHSPQPDGCLAAHWVLVIGASEQWEPELGRHLEFIVVSRWMKICAEMRFALLTPALNVPAIMEACTDPSTSGLKKIARVLRSARHAVRIGISKDWTDKVLAIAES